MKGARPDIATEIVRLRRTLRTLENSFSRLAPMLSRAMGGPLPVTPSGRRRPRLSPRARAALVLQGRYMGYMRQLDARTKAQIRRVRESSGVRAAIVKARQSLRPEKVA